MLTMNMTVTVMAVLVSSVLARSTMDEWPNFLSCSIHIAGRNMVAAFDSLVTASAC